MKIMLVATALAFATATLSAQPAKDLMDANAAARQHLRDVQPALALMRNEAEALDKISEVQKLLSGSPLSSIDRASHFMSDYADSLTKRGLLLPRDQMKIIMLAQRMLDDAHRVTPADYPRFRDDFHHEVVHPLELLVTLDMRELMSLANLYRGLDNSIRKLEIDSMNAINGSASDPTRR